MISLKKAIAASVLAASLAAPGGSVALADTGTCPDQAVFNVVLPSLLGLPGGAATITTNEQPTGRPGQCAGTFAVVSTATGATIASGFLLANHSGSNVTAYFAGSTATGAFFFGSLAFNGTAGTGSATAFVLTNTGCQRITATFAVNPLTGEFVPTSLTTGSCHNDDD
jgi:hypothetical protein